MRVEEIIANLEESRDWKFDNSEGWWVAYYKNAQLDDSITVRFYNVGVCYYEDDNMELLYNIE